jgi:FMN phosphatase YigB (HAD superfamily)
MKQGAMHAACQFVAAPVTYAEQCSTLLTDMVAPRLPTEDTLWSGPHTLRSANMSFRAAFLLDVDNTLLDNDKVIHDLKQHLAKEFSPDHQQHYWKVFDEHHAKYGFADYLGALQRYRADHECDPHFIKISLYLLEYPFAERLFPPSLKVIEHLQRQGTAIIFSEGDAVFQAHKVKRSGLYDAVEGRVMIYVHKQCRFADIHEHYPADHYVVVDDRLEMLTDLKKVGEKKITTVFVRQGHHARETDIASLPQADVMNESIGELLTFDLSKILHRDQ